MTRCGWMEEETEIFLSSTRDFITAILDLKEQRDAAVHLDLQAEMRERGLKKPWQTL